MASIGRYQVLAKIAAGGMAEVYLARTQGLAGFSKVAAVKRILPHVASNPEFMQLFVNEANLCLQLSHPNIVETMEFGQDGDSYFLAMEYVEGATLRDLLRAAGEKGQRLPVGVGLKIISLMLEGLGYAHELRDNAGVLQNVVHRDISPHNVLVARSGAVKVADFGIAKAASVPSLTKTGQVRGKVRYMSPEQIQVGPLDARSDLFAVGITLFEVLTGHRPFPGESEAESMVAITGSAPTPLSQYLPEVPEGLQAVLDRALAKKPDDRYPNAGQMQAELEAVLVKLGMPVKGADISAVVEALVPRREELAAAIAESEPAALPMPPKVEEPAFPGPTQVDHARNERLRAAPLQPAAPQPVSEDGATDRQPAVVRSSPKLPAARIEEVDTDRRLAATRGEPAPRIEDVDTDRRPKAERSPEPTPPVDVGEAETAAREAVVRPATAENATPRRNSLVAPAVQLATAWYEQPTTWIGALAVLGIGVALAVSQQLGREHSPEDLTIAVVQPKPSAPAVVDAGPARVAAAPQAASDAGLFVMADGMATPAPSPNIAPPPPAPVPAPPPPSGGGGGDGSKRSGLIIVPRGTVNTAPLEDEDGMAIIPMKRSEWSPLNGYGTLKLHLSMKAAVAIDDTDEGVVQDVQVRVRSGEHLVRTWAFNGQNKSYKILVRPEQLQSLVLNP